MTTRTQGDAGPQAGSTRRTKARRRVPDNQPEHETGARQPAPGLDEARHAAAQRTAHQAEVLRKGVFPALMASALGFDDFFETSAYKLFLERLLEDAGNPTDPIERMLVEQLAMAHFRIAQLHVSAGHAKVTEVIKMYNSVAARMLGEFRRTALALRAYRTRVPEGKPEKSLKILKMAQ